VEHLAPGELTLEGLPALPLLSKSPKLPVKATNKMRTKLPVWTKSSSRRPWVITMAAALMLGGSAPFCWSGPSNQTDQVRPQPSAPWQDNQIIQPEQLVKALSAAKGQKPLVFCVGFPVLFQGGHIVGAKFAGPACKPQGIQALKRAAQGLPRDKQIVVYCGCCPWKRCPNIRPAFAILHDLGFTNVKVLSIPTNFREDWVDKGFPIEKGPEKE
jgi:thiosulfate/3-mercaptopyruvate sulfurtransferase